MKRFFSKLLWNLILNILALWAVIFLLSDVKFSSEIDTTLERLQALVIAGLVIGLLNIFLKPLITLLSLPVIFLTVGLFLLVINSFIFYLTVQIMPSHEIAVIDQSAYFWGALVFSIVNTIEHIIFPFRPKKKG
jgi:putative membrane protein